MINWVGLNEVCWLRWMVIMMLLELMYFVNVLVVVCMDVVGFSLVSMIFLILIGVGCCM